MRQVFLRIEQPEEPGARPEADRYETLAQFYEAIVGALAPRWAWHAELAWRDLSGGSLDSLVDDWHDVFGLGGGSRNRATYGGPLPSRMHRRCPVPCSVTSR